MPERGQVDPDLVGPAGLQVASDESMARPPLDHRVAGPGRPASGDDRHPQPVLGVAADRPFQDALVGRQPALHDRQVAAGKRAVRQLGRQGAVGDVVAGHEHQARGALVQSVDDPRPARAAGRRPLATPPQQGVDEGARGVSGRGMDHHPGRLVQDDQVAILVDHVQRDRLRHGLQADGGGKLELDQVAAPERVGGPGWLAVHRHLSSSSQAGGGGPAELGLRLGQPRIQAAGRALDYQ